VDSPITPNDLKNLLSSLALSRGELADLLGVSKSTVDGWCSNKSIGKKRQQQLRVLILEHRLAAASAPSDPSLEFFNGFKLGPSSFTPRQWETIRLAASIRDMTPGSFLKWAVYSVCNDICSNLEEAEK